MAVMGGDDDEVSNDAPDDGGAALDAAVNDKIGTALDAVNDALDAQRGDPGNATDANDQAVMTGLIGVQSRLGDVAAAQSRDMGEPPMLDADVAAAMAAANKLTAATED
jgi:hypothetical protein